MSMFQYERRSDIVIVVKYDDFRVCHIEYDHNFKEWSLVDFNRDLALDAKPIRELLRKVNYLNKKA